MELFFLDQQSEDVSVLMEMIPCGELPPEPNISKLDQTFLIDYEAAVTIMYDPATVDGNTFCVNKSKLNELNKNFSFSYAQIYMYPCNSSARECQNEEAIREKLVHTYTIVNFQDFSFDETNYNTPFQPTIQSLWQDTEYNTQDILELIFKRKIVHTDKGLVVKDIQTDDQIVLDKIYSKKVTNNQITENPGGYLVIILEIAGQYDQIERTYPKFQDLLTNLGGSIESVYSSLFFLLTMLAIFGNWRNKRYYKEFIDKYDDQFNKMNNQIDNLYDELKKYDKKKKEEEQTKSYYQQSQDIQLQSTVQSQFQNTQASKKLPNDLPFSLVQSTMNAGASNNIQPSTVLQRQGTLNQASVNQPSQNQPKILSQREVLNSFPIPKQNSITDIASSLSKQNNDLTLFNIGVPNIPKLSSFEQILSTQKDIIKEEITDQIKEEDLSERSGHSGGSGQNLTHYNREQSGEHHLESNMGSNPNLLLLQPVTNTYLPLQQPNNDIHSLQIPQDIHLELDQTVQHETQQPPDFLQSMVFGASGVRTGQRKGSQLDKKPILINKEYFRKFVEEMSEKLDITQLYYMQLEFSQLKNVLFKYKEVVHLFEIFTFYHQFVDQTEETFLDIQQMLHFQNLFAQIKQNFDDSNNPAIICLLLKIEQFLDDQFMNKELGNNKKKELQKKKTILESIKTLTVSHKLKKTENSIIATTHEDHKANNDTIQNQI